MSKAYKVSLTAPFSVIVRQEDGSVDDLNAQGEAIQSKEQLRAFVRELRAVGTYPSNVRDALLSQIDSEFDRWVPAHYATYEQIEALRTEAGEAGDPEMVSLCNLALCGDADALYACGQAISNAEADDE